MPPKNYLRQPSVSLDFHFPIEAYQFVRDSLTFAEESLRLQEYSFDSYADDDPIAIPIREKHLSGQELCEAIRQYALIQFGLMARIVLRHWGIESTSDFGDIVFCMIDAGIMRKSIEDRRYHFDDVYSFEDFDSVFSINGSLMTRNF
jgi:uncharacterized repeat protein (TIGR04138 family)